jgi:zinc D-Ala-D-Ala carboxypeptidase
MKLSENFTLQELIKSATANRNDIDNYPSDPIAITKLELLAKNLLQPIRDHFGRTRVNSGFRCFDLECSLYQKRVNSIYTSYGEGGVLDWFRTKSHPKGEAADIEIDGIDNQDLFNWIRDNLEYDQLFLEYYIPGDPSSGWVHVSYSGTENRMESGRIK